MERSFVRIVGLVTGQVEDNVEDVGRPCSKFRMFHTRWKHSQLVLIIIYAMVIVCQKVGN